MPRLDVLADLQETRPVAPPELRERVRAIAAAAAPPRRRLTWRRAALVLVPIVVAAAVGAAVIGRGGGRESVRQGTLTTGLKSGAAPARVFPAGAPTALQDLHAAAAPPPSKRRLQDYGATLRLRVRDGSAISDATKAAVRIAASLGGFASVVTVNVDRTGGDALLRLRVPVTKVETALGRLSELGTITGESVSVQDVQAGVNAIDRTIARLQRQLRLLRAETPTPQVQRRIEQTTAEVERLQRSRATTVRGAKLATVELQLTTRVPVAPPRPARHGPLHGAVIALTWLGIGALYALIVGGPVLALLIAGWLAWRGYRRRAERRLLAHK